jgi:hypothetical protein
MLMRKTHHFLGENRLLYMRTSVVRNSTCTGIKVVFFRQQSSPGKGLQGSLEALHLCIEIIGDYEERKKYFWLKFSFSSIQSDSAIFGFYSL